jgi:choice-of-anchor C domain-containing protein
MCPTRIVGVAIVLALSSAAANANLVTNGSFEQPGTGCASATTSLPGWTVAGNIDIDNATASCSTIPAADGSYFVDLTGSYTAGSISQALLTTAGETYLVSFAFGGNPQWQYLSYPNDSAVKSMDVGIDGSVVGTYSIDTTGLGFSDAGWSQSSFLFTATSATTLLAFTSLNSGGVYGPLLDNVIVEQVPAAVPEPGTLALLSLGLAGLGVARRRRAD